MHGRDGGCGRKDSPEFPRLGRRAGHR
jgi:hypothetical protein